MVEEKEEDGLVGEEVEFLNTTVTVSRLPTVQFPEPTHKSKGTRLVDRWNNTNAKLDHLRSLSPGLRRPSSAWAASPLRNRCR